MKIFLKAAEIRSPGSNKSIRRRYT